MTPTTTSSAPPSASEKPAPAKRGRTLTADQARAAFLEQAPSSAKGILARAFDGTAGRSNAIKAMCLSCSGFDRSDIEHCGVVLCPLHAYRPRFHAKANHDIDDDTSTSARE